MEILGRKWSFWRKHLCTLYKYPYYFIKCLFIFRRPLEVIWCYITLKRPKDNFILFRNGSRIELSSHPHDLITVFIIFVKKDYGNIPYNSTVIDVGSNIGVFALYAAQNGAKRIFAFEPCEEMYECLQRNIVINGFKDKIIPFRVAVTSVAGEIVRFSSSSGPYNKIIRGNSHQQFEYVHTTTLEEIFDRNALNKVDLLKIDAEGAEYDILFSTSPHIFGKINTIRMEYHKGKVEDLIVFLIKQRLKLKKHMISGPESGTLFFKKNSQLKN